MEKTTRTPEDTSPGVVSTAERAPTIPAPRTPPLVAGQVRRGSVSNAILVVALLVAVGGITFAAGRLTAPANASGGRGADTFTGGQLPGGNGGTVSGGDGSGGTVYGMPDGAMPGGIGGLGFASSLISGTVSAVDSDSITLTLESGATVEIATDKATTYHGQTAASAGDVQVGTTVAVEVSGFRGGSRNGAGPSAAPGASAAPAANPGAPNGQPGQGGFTPGTAVDVTITQP